MAKFYWALRVCQASILWSMHIIFPFCRWRNWGSGSWSNDAAGPWQRWDWTWAVWHLTPEHRFVPAHKRTTVSSVPIPVKTGDGFSPICPNPLSEKPLCLPFLHHIRIAEPQRSRGPDLCRTDGDLEPSRSPSSSSSQVKWLGLNHRWLAKPGSNLGLSTLCGVLSIVLFHLLRERRRILKATCSAVPY